MTRSALRAMGRRGSLGLACALIVLVSGCDLHSQRADTRTVASDVPPDRSSKTGEQVYTLKPGDELQISVWKEEGLDRKVLVRPDGMISFPLAGHLKAAGRTTQQVEAAIKARLARVIDLPVVTVALVSVPQNRIYVIGQVQRPGTFPAVQPVTVMQALALAGGLTPFGDEDAIVILRKIDGKQISIPFDYSKAKKGIGLDQNITLESGDVVVVPN